MKKLKLIGPFRQLVTMDNMPAKGPLSDIQLDIIEQAGILVSDGIIESVGLFRELQSLASETERIEGDYTAMPGMIDVHTHICWAGSRAGDYAMRLSGKDYSEIARKGGGIWSTVIKTREADFQELTNHTAMRAQLLLQQGITTIEVKSGYGLNASSELKMLRAIREAAIITKADLVSTCLAAHIKPKDFIGSPQQYLKSIVDEILPVIQNEKLSTRTDIYIDDGAFSAFDGRYYLQAAKAMNFDLVVHADQFVQGGLMLAIELNAVSADHLETTDYENINSLAKSSVIPVLLPGSSLGLGGGFAPARKMLNAGTSMVIASDWNPGSAPMGKLLTQASILGIYEKLTMAETLASLTCRAAPALRLNDRGIIRTGMIADIIAFPCSNYRDIVYYQGGMMPAGIWKKGKRVSFN